jgi:hypothetical protein
MNTMQQEFDAVVAHLYKQGRPAKASYDPNREPQCAYRGDDGLSCAVGCRIPDDNYSAEMEGTGISFLCEYEDFNLPSEIRAYHPMFSSLQAAHDADSSLNSDGDFDSVELTEKLAHTARVFNLTFTPPK